MGLPPPAGYHAPPGAPYPLPMDPRLDPRFFHQQFPPMNLPHARQEHDIRGQDPKSLDMSNDKVRFPFTSACEVFTDNMYF